MSYCSAGDKAVIKYKLGNKERTFEIEKTPIEINVYQKPVVATENFSPEGFTLRFYSPNNRNWIEGQFKDFLIYPSSNNSYGTNYAGIALRNCVSDDISKSEGKPIGPGVDITTITIDFTQKCPIQYQGKNRCYIEVKYNDLIIFVDQGDCPASFEVQCGDCPEGTIRCDSPKYPGYCCIPCAELAQRVNAMIRRLK